MRYAVYFTPPASDPLTRTAEAWLGRSAFTGETLPASSAGVFSAGEVAALTSEARRYGFHATLAAPFRLREGATEAALLRAADSFCTGRESFDLPPLQVSSIGPFFALRPSQRSVEVEELAAAAVDHFAPLRAPLTATEIERRNPERLSPRQRDYLERYGYPFVREEFRFHMTLTCALEPAAAGAVRQALEARFAPVLGRAVPVQGISVFVEREPGAAFTVLSSHSFGRAEAAGLTRYA